MFSFLLSSYTKMYTMYKKQMDNIKQYFVAKIYGAQLHFLIKYGKLISYSYTLIEKLENNRYLGYFIKFFSFLKFNTSSTHWIRTVTSHINLNVRKPWYNFSFLNQKNDQFVTIYSYQNFIKQIKTVDDVYVIFNNYIDNYRPFLHLNNISHTLITMKLNKSYVQRIIVSNFITIHSLKLVKIAEEPFVTDLSSTCAVETMSMYFPTDINNMMEKLKYIESTDKYFIYITYIHPVFNKQIGIDITAHYFAANSILSNTFIYNYLENVGLGSFYHDNYTIELLDRNFNKITLNSNQYITIYKTHYLVKEMTIKMI